MRRFLPFLLITASPAISDHNWDHRDIDAGRTLYADQCAACHGANLEGQPDWRTAGPDGVLPAPPHDGSGHTWHHDDQLLFDYTKYGGEVTLEAMGIADFNSGMPGFEDTLTDDEIWDILAYIRSTWTDREREVQASRNPEH
ncbi:c-type cytochrome [Nereida sp. MMG025]|uniref:c-type cytochrome n=1 Tax=Nereida sp. MMG025 TaxID=2909981 RepID=UPI001F35A049|nr:cytochrome c [Nereida sp. MMG025]MCF6445191.1 cytochrome c [Nereida sp. MMG025]